MKLEYLRRSSEVPGKTFSDIIPLSITAWREPRLEFTTSELQVLLECMDYGIERVREAQGTPYELRQDKLRLLAEITAKLRKIVTQKTA